MTVRTAIAPKFWVYNTTTGESHGSFDTLDEARGAVEFDRLTLWEIRDDTGLVLVERVDDETHAHFLNDRRTRLLDEKATYVRLLSNGTDRIGAWEQTIHEAEEKIRRQVDEDEGNGVALDQVQAQIDEINGNA